MERNLYDEMTNRVNEINTEMNLHSREVFVFGHCNASLELIDYLEELDIYPLAILDNNPQKRGGKYKGIIIINPKEITDIAQESNDNNSVVLITSRFYSSMQEQLRNIGYGGQVRKVIDYNTYADYSLSKDTISRMMTREKHGEDLLSLLSTKYEGYFKVFCPFNALGDIYFMISYWKAFAQKREINNEVFCVPGKVLSDVIHMFGEYPVEVYNQKELDAMIQAALYTQDDTCFIAHQDRPYVVNLSKALYVKKIPLEKIYCCGVFGLPEKTKPEIPKVKDIPKDIGKISFGKSVIISPYAKSVPLIDSRVWDAGIKYYKSKGYKCFTNVVGSEAPLEGTEPISPSLFEMISIVEYAGIFIGIRSGLCDIIREANAKKIALYPDYYYSDTAWKAIEMYYIEKFDYNLLATEKIEWEKL